MPNNPYSGFAALGDLVTGGASREAEANYPKYLKESADGYSALDKAAIIRAQRIARDNLPAAVRASGVAHPDLATSILSMATGQPNLGTLTDGLGDLADQEMDRQALEALQAGDLARAQRLSAVKTDKILPTLGAGGKAVFTPVTGDVAMTPLGDAAIDADEALAAQRHASAGAADARAERSRRPTPAKPSPIQARAATLADDVAIIESQIGRPMTAEERARYLQTGKFIDVRAKPLGESEAGAIGGTVTPARAHPAEADVLQAIQDARRAIATGRITKEAARQRLIEAGMPNAAGRL